MCILQEKIYRRFLERLWVFPAPAATTDAGASSVTIRPSVGTFRFVAHCLTGSDSEEFSRKSLPFSERLSSRLHKLAIVKVNIFGCFLRKLHERECSYSKNKDVLITVKEKFNPVFNPLFQRSPSSRFCPCAARRVRNGAPRIGSARASTNHSSWSRVSCAGCACRRSKSAARSSTRFISAPPDRLPPGRASAAP